MFCHLYNIKSHQNRQNENTVCHYIVLHNAIIIPVYCVCLVHAMGISAGLRQVVFMQFDVDADTEYIKLDNAAQYQLQQLNIKNNSNFK